MYVDDVLALGQTEIVERVLVDIQKKWSLSIKGLLVRDGAETTFKAESLRFLGCTLELGVNQKVKLHQIEYIKERLRDRHREMNQARVGLPESMEGKVEPAADRTTPHYLEMKHKC